MENNETKRAIEWSIDYIAKYSILFNEFGQVGGLDEDVEFYIKILDVKIKAREVIISQQAGELLAIWAQGGVNRAAYDLAQFICEINVRNDVPISPSLRTFASTLIAGNLTRPPPTKGRVKDKNVLRNYLVLDLLAELEKRYVLGPRSRNEATYHRTSPHDIAVMAFEKNGIKMSESDIRNIDNNKQLKERWQSLKDMDADPNLTEANGRLVEKLLRRS